METRIIKITEKYKSGKEVIYYIPQYKRTYMWLFDVWHSIIYAVWRDCAWRGGPPYETLEDAKVAIEIFLKKMDCVVETTKEVCK